MARRPRDDSSGRDLRKDFVQGAVLGGLLYAALWAMRVQVALFDFEHGWGIVAAVVGGGVLYVVRLRSILWLLSAATVAVFALAVTTPVFSRSARSLIRQDPLRKADAVVVLGSSTTKEKRLDDVALIRMVEGLRLVRDGWAPALVWTRVGGEFPDPSADVRELARLCGSPRVEVVGPVLSTRDEAQLVATLAEKRGWKRLILVTSPYHSARAYAVFSKLGLEIISHPAPERQFAPSDPRGTRQRLEVFRWWLYERARWFYYSVRGWV